MSLLLKALLRALLTPLLGLAFAQMKFWDAPTSEMDVAPGGTGDAGGDAGGDAAHDDVDGQDNDSDAGDGDERADARRGREAGDRDEDDDQDDDPLNALGDDEDDEDGDTRPIEERFKKVLKAKRRLERGLKKNAGTLSRLKELQSAGVNLDDLIVAQRQLVNLEKRMGENPQLRALLGDEGSADRGPRKPAKGDRDPVKYPFKLDNESGQFFKQFHEDFLSLRDQLAGELADLREQVTGVSREHRQERTTATVQQWRTAAETASKQIPEGFRDLFMHAVGLEMRRAVRGEIKATPQQVIDAHLAKLKKKGALTDTTKKRASDAARESIARRNETLPRRPAGNGAPGPVKERRIPRMADFNRSLRSKFGGGA